MILEQALECIHPVNGGVFKAQFFIWIYPLEGRLAHQGSFVETTQDQFQFTWVGIDVTDGINSGDVGTVVEGVYLNGIFIHIQAPVAQWTKFWRQAKKRDEIIR